MYLPRSSLANGKGGYFVALINMNQDFVETWKCVCQHHQMFHWKAPKNDFCVICSIVIHVPDLKDAADGQPCTGFISVS